MVAIVQLEPVFGSPLIRWHHDFDACIALDRFDFAVVARPDDRYGLRLEAQAPERLPVRV